jgi:uncharacterized protein (AIM24 family)
MKAEAGAMMAHSIGVELQSKVQGGLMKGLNAASSAEIELDTKWGGFKNVFGDEGGFLVRASGTGKIVVAAYGAIETVELTQTLKSGEGLVMEFTGPGRVLTQTRNRGALIDWLTAELPFSRE